MVTEYYNEDVRSFKTTLLFIALANIFLGIFIWRVLAVGFSAFPSICLFFSIFFGLYVLNYRTLKIKITDQTLSLKFGVVRWRISLDNIKISSFDESPVWIKFGGAGVHFAFVNQQYRAFFNFLEYPKVLITFKEKQGPVQGLVFTTKKPDDVLKFIQERKINP